MPIRKSLVTYHLHLVYIFIFQSIAQSAGAVEYTDSFSDEGWNPFNEGPIYNSKQFNSEVTVMQELWECEVPLHCHCTQAHSSLEW